MPDRHLWEYRAVQDLLLITLAAVFIYVCYELRGLLIPIAIGFAAAYAINPLLSRAEGAWNIPRVFMIVIIDSILVLAAAAICLLLAPRLFSELDRLAEKAPVYMETVMSRLREQFGERWLERIQQNSTQPPEGSTNVVGLALGSAKNAAGLLKETLGATFYLLSAVVLIPFYFNFFAWKFQSIKDVAQKQIPHRNRDLVLRIAKRMDAAIGQFLRGRLLVVGAMMILFSFAFWIIGVPYWFLLGSITGMLNFVPFFAFLGCIAAVLVMWADSLSGNSEFSWMAVLVWPVVAYSIVQFIEGWILTPWIQSQSMKLNAVTVIIIVMIGGALGGIWGLLLALPAFDCLRILFEELLLPRYRRWVQSES